MLATEYVRECSRGLAEALSKKVGLSEKDWRELKLSVHAEHRHATLSTMLAVTATIGNEKVTAQIAISDTLSSSMPPWTVAGIETYMNDVDLRTEVLFFRLIKLFDRTLEDVSTKGDKLFVKFKNGVVIEGTVSDIDDKAFLAKLAMVHDIRKEDENASIN